MERGRRNWDGVQRGEGGGRRLAGEGSSSAGETLAPGDSNFGETGLGLAGAGWGETGEAVIAI
jgi:hypothetical protein